MYIECYLGDIHVHQVTLFSKFYNEHKLSMYKIENEILMLLKLVIFKMLTKLLMH
jgi:hypothetical protein